MTEERFKITKFEDHPEWDHITIKDRWDEWTIDSNNGDVEISNFSEENGTKSLFLNQDELKQLIQFLQSKIITNE